jgi:hypothetical protein
MKWPLWLRIVTTPMRLILFIPVMVLVFAFMLMGEEETSDGILTFIFTWGLE